jgi:3-isopropylmalate/(R)-2-methylmalate dehydratase small subunit
MLPVVLSEEQIEQLFIRASQNPGYELTVDLERQWVTDDQGLRFTFDVDSFRREYLLKGLDDIGLTLQHEEKIREHEARRNVFG